jgi:hypothetical protein
MHKNSGVFLVILTTIFYLTKSASVAGSGKSAQFARNCAAEIVGVFKKYKLSKNRCNSC